VSGATESHGGLPQYSPQAQQPYVVYEIHYEQTYQAPILTFSLKDLPPCDSAMDVDVIYRYLVPDHFKSVIRNYGPAGAIGARVRSFYTLMNTKKDTYS
jgi:ubiquitin-like-conjugating enzyme ATG10